MTKAMRIGREALLWTGGALGSLCLLMLVAGWLFNVTPLVFATGSMSPAYDAGALGVAHEVPAAELEVGDVVSVINAQGDRVTHRIVALAAVGDSAALTLQGDTNNVPDAEAYNVTSADRVSFGVPFAGYVLNAAASPFGLLVVALLVGSSLWLGFSRRDGDSEVAAPGRSRLLVPMGVASVVLAGTGLGATGQAPWAFTSAFWTDTATVTATATAPSPPTDTTGPTIVSTVPTNGASSNDWENIDCVAGSVTNSYCATVSDAGSGVASVTIKIVRTSTTPNRCWDGSNGASSFVSGNACAAVSAVLVAPGTAASGQWRVATLHKNAVSAGGYTVTITATDVAGNVTTVTRTFTIT